MHVWNPKNLLHGWMTSSRLHSQVLDISKSFSLLLDILLLKTFFRENSERNSLEIFNKIYANLILSVQHNVCIVIACVVDGKEL